MKVSIVAEMSVTAIAFYHKIGVHATCGNRALPHVLQVEDSVITELFAAQEGCGGIAQGVAEDNVTASNSTTTATVIPMAIAQGVNCDSSIWGGRFFDLG